MKRAASSTKTSPKAKKPRVEVPDYHAAETKKDDEGNAIWPAPKSQIEGAQKFIRECAAARKSTLIVPDKDADGLTSGAILHTTLRLLGLPEELLHVHVLSKGTNVHDGVEREAMAEHSPEFIFVLDHGSRQSRKLIDAPHRCLVVDHHWIPDFNSFPEGAEFVNACDSPPVATTSLLIYTICRTLHSDVEPRCDWLAVIGTYGDLSSTIKWEPPFPDMKACLSRYTKKALNDCVGLLNAPRRTAEYDVRTAWDALLHASSPSPSFNHLSEPGASDAEVQEPSPYRANLLRIINNRRLISARQDINAEVERCTHTPPKFSRDASIAVFRIRSRFQVHPVIATRWAGHLSSKRLEVVLVANDGYLDGKVNFSCRIPRCARARALEAGSDEVDIIRVLRHAAASSESGDLLERLGDSFARGHKEASGGIVGTTEFEELMSTIGLGEKAVDADAKGKGASPKKRASALPEQKNTLANYFVVKS